MAIAIPIAVMAHDGGKKVHPFFSKAQEVENGDSQAQSALNSTSSDDTIHKDSQGPLPADIASLPSAGQTGGIMRQSHISVVVANSRAPETASLDADPNHERRKRVKVDNGDEKLEAGVAVSNDNTHSSSSEQVGQQNSDRTAGANVGLQQSLVKETLSKDPKNKGIEISGPILKLNGKGTLASPKAKEKLDQNPVAKNPKSKSSPTTGKYVSRKGKNKIQIRPPPASAQATGTTSKSRIAVIRYRGDEVGEKIRSILSGGEAASPRRSPRKVAQKVSSSPKAPPKPAHPFFIKKPQAKKARDKRLDPTSAAQSQPKSELVIAANPSTGQSPDVQGSMAKTTASESLSSEKFGGLLEAARIRYPSAKEPPWPWRGISHVRDLPLKSESSHINLDEAESLSTSKKSKGFAVYVQLQESILHHIFERLPKYGHDPDPHGAQAGSLAIPGIVNDSESFSSWIDSSVGVLRVPQKLVLTGPHIQSLILEHLASGSMISRQQKSLSKDPKHARPDPNLHPALFASYLNLGSAMTPFDINKCETKIWTQKYSPSTAAEVLQPGRESAILFEWLLSHTIHKVDTGKHKRTSSGSIRGKLSNEKSKRKRRRGSLGGFIASESDEESGFGEMTDIEDNSRPLHQRSYVRRGSDKSKKSALKRSLNTVLLSGPNGSGKTAAVYAAAKELGFEVFEINPGSRRNGKDILDKIGDMTENHLVQQVSKTVAATMPETADGISVADTKDDSDNTRQGTMTSFFEAANSKPPNRVSKSKKNAKPTANDDVNDMPQKQQKQSLILFEEVDVLFQEDKQFWATVLALAVHSKRPIVLTCNDENVVPQDALNLHALLRFVPPPIDLAVDYLLLLAAREGHLLSRHAVKTLYISKDYDIRASIAELQFWGQMGVGDDKGGLNWMVDRWPPGCDYDESGDRFRAMSKGTYLPGMGWSDRDLNCSLNDTRIDKDHNLFCEAYASWDISTDDLAFRPQHCLLAGHSADSLSLEAFAAISENLSAADIFCGGMRTGSRMALDPSHPLPSMKARQSYTESYPLLPVYSAKTFTNLHTEMSALTTLLSEKALDRISIAGTACPAESFNEKSFIEFVVEKKIMSQTKVELTRRTFAAMDPIAGDIVSDSGAIISSCFDREFRVLVEEIAPYVRAIAEHDLVLEAARAQSLSSVKRARTSRASRSALEGGRREEKRRDRWFTKDLNLQQVLATGGTAWYRKQHDIVPADTPSTVTSNDI